MMKNVQGDRDIERQLDRVCIKLVIKVRIQDPDCFICPANFM